MSVGIMLRSDYFGAGKTYTMVSFARPDTEPKRLVFDCESRAEALQSSDGLDHPESGKFAFDLYPSAYSAVEFVRDVATKINAGKFEYNMIGIDSVAMFQDALKLDLPGSAEIAALLNTIRPGCSKVLVTRKYDASDTPNYSRGIKNVVKQFLLLLRTSDVDFVVTTENSNVWIDYGRAGRDPATGQPYMKIAGKTATANESWLQMVDALFVLNRITGDRMTGKGQLQAVPVASLDTFNTKCSFPGVMPTFVFDSWGVFWAMVNRSRRPTAEDFAKLQIPGATYNFENTEMTIDDAKAIVMGYAKQLGVITEAKGSAQKLEALGKAAGLSKENILAQYDEWITMLEDVANGHTPETA